MRAVIRAHKRTSNHRMSWLKLVDGGEDGVGAVAVPALEATAFHG